MNTLNKEKLHIAIVILADAPNPNLGPAHYNLGWGNSTVLGHTIKEVVKTQINDLYVVLGADYEDVFTRHKHFPVQFIKNSNWDQTQSLDLKWVVSQMNLFELDGVLFLHSMQPELDYHFIKELIQSFQDHPKPVLSTQYPNGLGLPALLNMDLVSELKQGNITNWSEIFSGMDKNQHSFTSDQELRYLEDLPSYLKRHNDWFGEVNPI